MPRLAPSSPRRWNNASQQRLPTEQASPAHRMWVLTWAAKLALARASARPALKSRRSTTPGALTAQQLICLWDQKPFNSTISPFDDVCIRRSLHQNHKPDGERLQSYANHPQQTGGPSWWWHRSSLHNNRRFLPDTLSWGNDTSALRPRHQFWLPGQARLDLQSQVKTGSLCRGRLRRQSHIQ